MSCIGALMPARDLMRVAESVAQAVRAGQARRPAALAAAHADDSAVRIAPAEAALGWNFYVMSVNIEVARQLAQLPETGILEAKGALLEQKFVGWLNARAKARKTDDRVHFNLLSDLKSSRYGLF